MKPGILSYLLVAIQFGCLAVIALTGPWIARNPALFVIEAAGVALALWAIASIRVRDLSVLPYVREGTLLVHRGPYRLIRHPMYASLLLATLPLIIETPTPLRIGTWAILLVDILVKLRHEERLLVAAFPDYDAYRQQTKRLLPLVY